MVRIVLNTLICRIFSLLSREVVLNLVVFMKNEASPLGVKEMCYFCTE